MMRLDNPYAPPQSATTSLAEHAEIRLFGPRAIAAHCVLLTPLSGVVMAALNHWRLGNRAAFRTTLALWGLPSAALVVLLIAAGDRISFLRLAVLAWSVTAARTLAAEHKVLVEKHTAAGGKKARWYIVTALFLVALLAVGVVVVLGQEMLAGHD